MTYDQTDWYDECGMTGETQMEPEPEEADEPEPDIALVAVLALVRAMGNLGKALQELGKS